MPIFHDPHDSPPRRSSSRQMFHSEERRIENPRTEYDVSILEPENSIGRIEQDMLHGVESLESPYPGRMSLNRVDLIERLKRTKSPVWQDHQNVSCAYLKESRPCRINTSTKLTADRRANSATIQVLIDQILATDRRHRCSPPQIPSPHIHQLQTLFVISPQQVWRLNALGPLYTLETLERSKKMEALRAAHLLRPS